MKKYFFLHKKKLVTAVVILLLCLMAFFILHHRHAAPMKQEAIVVDAASVKQGNISIEVHAIGTLTASKTVPITSEIAGHVAKILFQDGGFVKEGTLLIQLDDAVYKAKFESSKANLNYSVANYHRMVLLGK
ncbi:MAG TPA: efflux RND transporter periplasmic adaptor subunit, partial [Gammaproteobacteria bacterium]|nr:efflux RND transporter periplasmic adaptor subunit [Gammaproteobacteria bacterium]